MSFDAGALTFKLQTTGAQVFRQEVTQADRDLERLGRTAQTTATGVARTGDATDRAGGAARDARGRFISQADATRQLGDESQRAAPRVQTLSERVKASESDMRTVGSTFMGVGAALAATTALTAKAAIDWESAWAGVTKTVDGTPEQMQEIEDGLRGLAKELPSSHGEIAAVAEAAGQLGVKTADVVAFTKTMIDLGETTNLSAEQAATSLAQFMNIMGTAGTDVGRLGATIVALGNDGASTEAEIVSMAQRIAGAGALVGASEGEVLALSNALASMGVTAELGGGVASRILQDLYSAVQTGGDKLDGFAKVAGVSAKEFAAAFQDDPVRAMGLFAGGLNGVEKSGGNVVQTLSDLGFKSTEEQRVLLQLKSGTDLLTDSLDLQKTAWDDNNALTAEAAKRYETVESKLQMAGNAVADAAISFGQVFLPILSKTSDIIKELAGGFASLPPDVQGVVSIIVALGAVVSLTGGAFLLALPKIFEFRAALQALAAQAPAVGAGLRGVLGFLGGPWGIAITVAITALTAFGISQMEAAAKAESYADTIDKVSGKVTNATRDMVKTNLTAVDSWAWVKNGFEGSAYDAAKKLGLSLDDVTDAAMGNVDALEKLSAATGKFGADGPEAKRVMDDLGLSSAEYLKAVNALEAGVTGESGSIDRAIEIAKQKQEADGESAKTSQTAAEKYNESADAVTNLNDQLMELIGRIDESNGKNLDASAAAIALEEAYDSFDEALAKNGQTLNITTAAGRENRTALDDIARAASESAQAIVDAGGSYEDYRASLESSRKEILKRIEDLGVTGQAAQDLANQILGIPTEREFKAIAETAEATRRAAAYKALIESIPSQRIVDIITRGESNVPQSGGTTRPGFANGGIVEFFARGGIREQHVAQIAAAGSMRVWAEPETGGEAYIPLSPAKRQRSMAILEDVAAHFGGTFIHNSAQSFAVGGVTAAAPASMSGMRISGTLDLGDGITGYLDGFVQEAVKQVARGLR